MTWDDVQPNSSQVLSLPQVLTDDSLPTLFADEVDKKLPHVRSSLYAPIRLKARASQCFEEVYSYSSKQDVWRSFKPYISHLSSTVQESPFVKPRNAQAVHKRQASLVDAGDSSPLLRGKSPQIAKGKSMFTVKAVGKLENNIQQTRVRSKATTVLKGSLSQAGSLVLQPSQKKKLRHTLE